MITNYTIPVNSNSSFSSSQVILNKPDSSHGCEVMYANLKVEYVPHKGLYVPRETIEAKKDIPVKSSLPIIAHLPKLEFKLLTQLKDDRDSTGNKFSERPLSEQAKRFKRSEKTIREGYKNLEELGLMGSLKGKGKGHITQRWITYPGYLWLVNQTSDVITDVIQDPSIYISSLEKEDKEILKKSGC